MRAFLDELIKVVFKRCNFGEQQIKLRLIRVDRVALCILTLGDYLEQATQPSDWVFQGLISCVQLEKLVFCRGVVI